MSLAIIAPHKNVQEWVDLFTNIDPTIKIQVYPDIDDRHMVETVVLWQHPHGILDKFPNLKLVCSMGSGVDHIVSDPSLSPELPITRIVDPRLTFSMTNYVIMGVLNYHRQLFRYIHDKQRKVWDMSNPEKEITVGVLGVGELGGDVLDKVSALGIKVIGYGNNPKSRFRHPYYYGDQLEDFLGNVNVIVCLLPLTEKTEGFLNISLFRKFQKGSYLINVARGKHLIEEDLMEAIDEGYIDGAMLDVFQTEPLPESHPFWEHEKIMVTPHIASITNPSAAAPQIMTNYQNLKEGKPLINQINRQQGY